MQKPDGEQRETASVEAIFYHYVVFDYKGKQELKRRLRYENIVLQGRRTDIFFPSENLILRDVRSPRYLDYEIDIPGTWYQASVGESAQKRAQELKAASAREEVRQVPADVLEWAKALYIRAHPPKSVFKITEEALNADDDFIKKDAHTGKQ